MNFPDYIERQLTEPPPAPPGRHNAMRSLALQMVGEAIPDDIIFDALRAWCPDRVKTEREIWDLIRGAHSRNPQPAKTFTSTSETGPLPTGLEDVHPVEFLERIFAPQDNIEIAWKDEQGRLNQNEIRTVARWGESKGRRFGNADGAYYCINPLLDGADRHNDSQLASYQCLLVELEVPKKERAAMDIDEKEAACEKFYAALLASKLPFAAIYTSGDASVHGLVKVNAADHDEWRKRMEVVYAYCSTMPGFDPSNKNPSRLSRLPGAMRGDRLQTLLSWDCERPDTKSGSQPWESMTAQENCKVVRWPS